jgi:hypothetical protein
MGDEKRDLGCRPRLAQGGQAFFITLLKAELLDRVPDHADDVAGLELFLAEDEGQASLRADDADQHLAASADGVDANVVERPPITEGAAERLLQPLPERGVPFDAEEPRVR